jgi:hypothetical protein
MAAQQMQSQPNSQPTAGGAGQPDYSAQWIEYYRSMVSAMNLFILEDTL